MDPVTAFGVATTAYKTIVAGFKVGKQVQIRKQKKEAELEAQRKQRQVIENTIIGGLVLLFIFFVVYVVYLVMTV